MLKVDGREISGDETTGREPISRRLKVDGDETTRREPISRRSDL